MRPLRVKFTFSNPATNTFIRFYLENYLILRSSFVKQLFKSSLGSVCVRVCLCVRVCGCVYFLHIHLLIADVLFTVMQIS